MFSRGDAGGLSRNLVAICKTVAISRILFCSALLILPYALLFEGEEPSPAFTVGLGCVDATLLSGLFVSCG